ncbi:glycosyltransferase [Hyphomicrobium facile]|uniref:Glycosyltransferase involved in cell wall bisynthesis n=1 Tax=Hyphomicrobium facile TaxID=51670 RepID=A0A1I7NIX4_9HYPH|nr:Glycosyltransferase involved in cell wall bisynthesis [Hyphomicrobium facile]
MTCLRLAQHWQSRFCQHIVALGPETRALEPAFRQLANSEITVAAESPLNHLAMWRRLRHIVRDKSPDALIIHVFGIPHLVAASAARSAGVRSLAVKAGNPPPLQKALRWRWAAVALGSQLLRCPIASCSVAVDEALRKLSVGMPKNSRALPNGIDIASLAARASRSRQARLDRAPVIGMVARLDAIKDHDTLLRAFGLVRSRIPDCELWIVGDGALRGALESKSHTYGIADWTKFLGDRADIPELLGQMDVYAFSTTCDEGFGIALVEAMAAGVAVVASDVPACREVLGHGEGGILVPPGNASALAQSIVEVLQNPAMRANKIEGAAARVEREYTIQKCAMRWEALLFPDTATAAVPDLQCAF